MLLNSNSMLLQRISYKHNFSDRLALDKDKSHPKKGKRNLNNLRDILLEPLKPFNLDMERRSSTRLTKFE